MINYIRKSLKKEVKSRVFFSNCVVDLWLGVDGIVQALKGAVSNLRNFGGYGNDEKYSAKSKYAICSIPVARNHISVGSILFQNGEEQMGAHCIVKLADDEYIGSIG